MTLRREQNLLASVKRTVNKQRYALKDNDSIKKLGFEILETKRLMRIAISKRAKKEFEKFEVRVRGRLKQVFKRWCNEQGLTSEMMNCNEGRTSRHKEMIHAFKAFKFRLYGFEREVSGIRTFFIVDADPAKKQNKAGPVLDRAKTRADDLLDIIEGKKKE